MSTFVDSLSEKGKVTWAELYEKFKGKKWESPTKDKRKIHLEGKLEAIEELEQIMKERPGYSVDVQGREGNAQA
jgi:N-acetyl-anhydromuramyl-L-alanine amidase AmpD